VNNVQVFAGYVLHIGSFPDGSKALSVGDSVICKVIFVTNKILSHFICCKSYYLY
jgi:hypothetical protein